MSTHDTSDAVDFMDDGETTVAVIDDEAYNVSSGEVVIHESGETVYLITDDDYYVAEYDADQWIILDEDVPQKVLDKLDEEDIRFADAEVQGFPIDIPVGFRSDEAVFRAAWQKERLRPSMDVAQQIQGAIQEVTLTLEVDEDGSIVVTDVSLWPNNSNVTVDL